MTTEKIKEEVKEEKPAEEQAPQPEPTLEEKVANLEAGMRQTVVVSNNLITYCNTIDKWRKMDFVPAKEEGQSEETTPVEETNEG